MEIVDDNGQGSDLGRKLIPSKPNHQARLSQKLPVTGLKSGTNGSIGTYFGPTPRPQSDLATSVSR